MTFFPVYLLLLVILVNRYVAGVFFKYLRGSRFDERDPNVEPTVAVIVPLFNEGEDIYHCVLTLLDQSYPPEKLSIVVVDDCSTDDSYQWAKKAEALHPARVTVLKNPVNMGKRRGINRAVMATTAEIVVSVDSDVLVDKNAIRALVQRFTEPEVAAVGGRVNVVNPDVNWLTRMLTVKFYFAYTYLKNVERAFQSVMCLSGCLTAYRRKVLLELHPILERRALFGVPIMYGEDRFLTRQIVKAGYKTRLTFDAQCWTKVPTRLDNYFSQQLRWRRSNIVDFMLGLTHAWRLHPVVAVHYVTLGASLFVYPFIIAGNIASGHIWELAVLHVGSLSVLALAYWLDKKNLPQGQWVHPIYFLGLTFIMPVTYLLMTLLAFFTLDSGSWETRGAPKPEPASPDEPTDGARDPHPVAPAPVAVAVAPAAAPAAPPTPAAPVPAPGALPAPAVARAVVARAPAEPDGPHAEPRPSSPPLEPRHTPTRINRTSYV